MPEDREPPQPEAEEESILEISAEDLEPEVPEPVEAASEAEIVVEPEPLAAEMPTAAPPPPAPAGVTPEAPKDALQQPPAPQSAEAPSAGTPPAAEQANWYVYTAGQVYGPYRTEDLRQWLQSGQVSWDSLVSRGQAEPWRPLRQVMEFYDPHHPYGGIPGGSAGAPGYTVAPRRKDRVVAGVLGILLGWLGGHHFYLENWLPAILYLIFSWTGIPGLLGLIEGIIYLVTDEDRFQRNYHNWFCSGP